MRTTASSSSSGASLTASPGGAPVPAGGMSPGPACSSSSATADGCRISPKPSAMSTRTVVSSEIADIFRNNALKNGLLPVVLPEAVVQGLMSRPDDVLCVDIEARELRTPGGAVHAFPLDAFARTCLLEGVDEMGYLLARSADIRTYEDTHHAR